ncbi:MAG: PIN domain-containing protein [Candidatus Woesearchaeota archaeon]|nr:PIN domain-containing protein [Candidatus Woesearchaeota archaeon]
MDLVVDANILMSALIATEGKTCDLMFDDRLTLFAPEFLFDEIEKHKEEVFLKSGLSEADFELFMSIISSRIEILPRNEFEKHIPEAREITPDPDDSEYFALALKLGCGIWSNDKRLKNQYKIRVYSTKDLLR